MAIQDMHGKAGMVVWRAEEGMRHGKRREDGKESSVWFDLGESAYRTRTL